MFNKLISLGNRAKNVGEYTLANAAFAVALYKFFWLTEAEREATSDEPPVAWLVWETRDQTGRWIMEVYYDLLVICTTDGKLNIPAPILASDAAVTALKAATVVERTDHNGRHTQDPADGEIAAMWQELAIVANSHLELGRAMEKVLGDVDSFRESLKLHLPEDEVLDYEEAEEVLANE